MGRTHPLSFVITGLTISVLQRAVPHRSVTPVEIVTGFPEAEDPEAAGLPRLSKPKQRLLRWLARMTRVSLEEFRLQYIQGTMRVILKQPQVRIESSFSRLGTGTAFIVQADLEEAMLFAGNEADPALESRPVVSVARTTATLGLPPLAVGGRPVLASVTVGNINASVAPHHVSVALAIARAARQRPARAVRVPYPAQRWAARRRAAEAFRRGFPSEVDVRAGQIQVEFTAAGGLDGSSLLLSLRDPRLVVNATIEAAGTAAATLAPPHQAAARVLATSGGAVGSITARVSCAGPLLAYSNVELDTPTFECVSVGVNASATLALPSATTPAPVPLGEGGGDEDSTLGPFGLLGRLKVALALDGALATWDPASVEWTMFFLRAAADALPRDSDGSVVLTPRRPPQGVAKLVLPLEVSCKIGGAKIFVHNGESPTPLAECHLLEARVEARTVSAAEAMAASLQRRTKRADTLRSSQNLSGTRLPLLSPLTPLPRTVSPPPTTVHTPTWTIHASITDAHADLREGAQIGPSHVHATVAAAADGTGTLVSRIPGRFFSVDSVTVDFPSRVDYPAPRQGRSMSVDTLGLSVELSTQLMSAVEVVATTLLPIREAQRLFGPPATRSMLLREPSITAVPPLLTVDVELTRTALFAVADFRSHDGALEARVELVSVSVVPSEHSLTAGVTMLQLIAPDAEGMPAPIFQLAAADVQRVAVPLQAAATKLVLDGAHVALCPDVAFALADGAVWLSHAAAKCKQLKDSCLTKPTPSTPAPPTSGVAKSPRDGSTKSPREGRRDSMGSVAATPSSEDDEVAGLNTSRSALRPVWEIGVSNVEVEATISNTCVLTAGLRSLQCTRGMVAWTVEEVAVALCGTTLIRAPRIVLAHAADLSSVFVQTTTGAAGEFGARAEVPGWVVDVEGLALEVPHHLAVGDALDELKTTAKALPRAIKDRLHEMAPLSAVGTPVVRRPGRATPIGLHVRAKDVEFIVHDKPFETLLASCLPVGVDEHEQRLLRDRMIEARVRELQASGLEMGDEARDAIRANAATKNAELFVARAKSLAAARDARHAPLLALHVRTLDLAFAVDRGASLLSSGPPPDPESTASRVRSSLSWDKERVEQMQRLRGRLQGMDAASAVASDFRASFAVCGDIHLVARDLRMNLRDYPASFLVARALKACGPIIAVEPEAEPSAVSAVVVPLGASNAWRVLRTVTPLKIFHALAVAGDSVTICWGPAFQGPLAALSDAFGRLTPVSSDPSPPLAWWDKMRYLIHGRLSLSLTSLDLRLLATTSPYDKSAFVQIRAKAAELAFEHGRITCSAANLALAQTPGDAAPHDFVDLPAVAFTVGLAWQTARGDEAPLSHMAVQHLTARARAQLPDGGETYDTYALFRSSGLQLSLNIHAPPTTGGQPVVALDVSRLTWLLRWWRQLRNPLSLPVYRGSMYRVGRAGPQSLGKLIGGVTLLLRLAHPVIQMWEEPTRMRGLVVTSQNMILALRTQQTRAPYTHPFLGTAKETLGTAMDGVLMRMDDSVARIFTPEGMEAFLDLYQRAALTESDSYKGDFFASSPRVHYAHGTAFGDVAKPFVDALREDMTPLTAPLDFGPVIIDPDPSVPPTLLPGAVSHRWAATAVKALWTVETRNCVYAWVDKYRTFKMTKGFLDATRGGKAGDTSGEIPAAMEAAPSVTASVSQDLLSFFDASPETRVLHTEKAGDAASRSETPPPTAGSEGDVRPEDLDFSIAFTNPQFNLVALSRDECGAIVMTARGMFVRSITHREEGALARTEVLATSDLMQWYAASLADDVFGGVVWIPTQSLGADLASHGPLQRIVPYCPMSFSYVYYGDRARAQAEGAIPTVSLKAPHVEFAMTARQYEILIDTIVNLVLGFASKAREEQDQVKSLVFEAHLDPATQQDVGLLQTTLERERAELHAIRDLIRDNATTHMYSAPELQSFQQEHDRRKEKVQRLKHDLAVRLKSAKRLARQHVAWLRVEYALDSFTWRLLRAPDPPATLLLPQPRGGGKSTSLPAIPTVESGGEVTFCMFSVRGMTGQTVICDDESGTQWYQVKEIEVSNCVPGTQYPRLLAPLMVPGAPAGRSMLRIYTRLGAPVAGIPVYEHFEVNIHPVKIALTSAIYQQLRSYFVPDRAARAVAKDAETSASSMSSPGKGRHVSPARHMSPARRGPAEGPAGASRRRGGVDTMYSAPALARQQLLRLNADTIPISDSDEGNDKKKKKKEKKEKEKDKKDKKKKDELQSPQADVELMLERAKTYRTFVYFKISPFVLEVTYRSSETQGSVKDIKDAIVDMVELSVRGQTYSWKDVYSSIEDQITGCIRRQIFAILMHSNSAGDKGTTDESLLVEEKKKEKTSRLKSLFRIGRKKQEPSIEEPVVAKQTEWRLGTAKARKLFGGRADNDTKHAAILLGGRASHFVASHAPRRAAEGTDDDADSASESAGEGGADAARVDHALFEQLSRR